MENKTQAPSQNGVVVIEKTLADQILNKVNAFQQNKSIKLPDNYSAENALKSAWLMLQDVEDKDHRKALEICTQKSVANALFEMVIQGLNPVKKQCYFIVRGKDLCMDRSYAGTIAVAKRDAGVIDVVGHAIYEKDEFAFELDTETGFKRITKHVQTLNSIDSPVIGAYAIVTMADKSMRAEIMTIAQIRQAWNQGSMKGNSPAHKNFTDEMAKRTVINRACKVPINSSDDAALYNGNEDNDRPLIEVREEIAENANKQEIGFTDAKVENLTPVFNPDSEITEPANQSKAPF